MAKIVKVKKTPVRVDSEEQKRLHATAAKFCGAIQSGISGDSKTVRETIRKRLASKYGR